MSAPPPYYNQQPQGQYYPQSGQAYPQGQYPPPQNGYGQYPNQPQVVYVERQPEPQQDNFCLHSLLMLCCGCFLGEMLCDSPCLCLMIPCPIRLPSFGRR
ncbi:hypothetical protein PRIPAC_74138 [Pristionchus pacificus]|uniref:Uncharacterized protein n=1 Tax=Pristionchus pacificus TaxID=54126 RepID=A0A2A6CG56_PRIPA|nr:hypothetical protein PRIPAC_74138 [Pristionchus pacificus]|eukprot:PDM77001.1 hypothetical protein PRIPAC_42396 [Pristionchus pacificus]